MVGKITLPVVGIVVFLSGLLLADPPADSSGPGKLELDGAMHRLEKFEQRVARSGGQTLRLSYTDKEAIRRIKELHEKYPDHPQVQEMVKRLRKVYMESTGDAQDLPPNVLAYRENEQKLKTLFFKEAERQYEVLLKGLRKDGTLLEAAFPSPDPSKVDLDEVVGKYVILEDFSYPSHQFRDEQREFCYVGSPRKGFYYVRLGQREWLGVYEALKRYRRFINRDMPEDMAWTLVGKITALELIVPQPGEEKTMTAYWGWAVEPVAIWVPQRTLALFDPEAELAGRFAGEERMEEVKSELYTVTSVPDDVDPKRLTEIFVTAIKEKNFPLYLECIDPARHKTPTGRSRCLYHWDLHQERFASWYCHIVVGEPIITVVQGFDSKAANVDWLLTDEDKARLTEHSDPLVEQAELKTRAFNEKGKQYGSPKPRFFRRTEKKRWYIINYPQPF